MQKAGTSFSLMAALLVGTLALPLMAQAQAPNTSGSAVTSPASSPAAPAPAPVASPVDTRVEQLERRVDMLEMQVKLLLERIVGGPGRATPQATVSGAPAGAGVSAIEVGDQKNDSKSEDSLQEGASLKLVKWSYSAKRGSYTDYYQITYVLKNEYDKPVKLIDGSIGFFDLLGEHIYGIKMDKDVKIPAKKEVTFRGDYKINQFINSQSRMRDMAQSDITAKMEINKIVFSDNTVQSFSK